jgi:hypothetical protein
MPNEVTPEMDAKNKAEKNEEDFIVIPIGYRDPIITKAHWATKGENVSSCQFVLMDPIKQLGKTVQCPECGKSFKVVSESEFGPAEPVTK